MEELYTSLLNKNNISILVVRMLVTLIQIAYNRYAMRSVLFSLLYEE